MSNIKVDELMGYVNALTGFISSMHQCEDDDSLKMLSIQYGQLENRLRKELEAICLQRAFFHKIALEEIIKDLECCRLYPEDLGRDNINKFIKLYNEKIA